MTEPPDNPCIYHITHVDNLPGIIQAGKLWSDAVMRQAGGQHQVIGYAHIKDRRLSLPVSCHPQTTVGEYVPFYFCPRSAMLYVIHKLNPELQYQGGQTRIVHLVARVGDVVAWAEATHVRWVFSDSNAASRLANSFRDLKQLDEINWPAVESRRWTDFRDEKQAEFLVHENFPWELVREIGVCNRAVEKRVLASLEQAGHRPVVSIKPNWYY